MEKKREVGKYFEIQLQGGKETPSPHLWERLKNTLDNVKPVQKRSPFRLWLVLLPLGLILAYMFWPATTATEETAPSRLPPKNKEERVAEPAMGPIAEPGPTEAAVDILEGKNQNPIRKNANNPGNSKGKLSPTTTDYKRKSGVVDSSYQVIKTYHYHNPSTGESWETTDKQKIDSIMNDEPHKTVY